MAFEQGHAFLVGVGADLKNTIDDAKGLGTILRDPERCAYPAGQVTVLTELKATRALVLDGLAELAGRTNQDSTVIVYFSGHGYFVTANGAKQYFLLPYDYDLGDLTHTAISDGEFAAALGKVRAQKLLVLLDCCHAAGVEKTKAPGQALEKAPIPPEAEKMFKEGRGRFVIASSTAAELSYAGEPYSAFTTALIEGFTGTGASEADSYVRVADLAMYASKRVPELTGDRQHPVLRFMEADNFVVSYYAGGNKVPKGSPFKTPPRIELVAGGLAQARASGAAPTFSIVNEKIQGQVLQGDFNAPITINNTWNDDDDDDDGGRRSGGASRSSPG